MRSAPEPPGDGQPVDFTEIYQEEFPYVWRTLRRLGVVAGDLEDRVHDVFVVVYRRLAEVDPARPIRPWLFGIALRIAANARRRTRQSSDLDVEALPSPSVRADDRVESRESWALLCAALDRLDLDRRATLILHDIDGHTAPEVAEALGIPINTVYSRLRIGREELASALKRLRARRDSRAERPAPRVPLRGEP